MNYGFLIGEIINLVLLTYFSYQDIRKKMFSVIFVLLFVLIEFLMSVLYGNDLLSILLGSIPGLICILISLSSKQKMGMGDALIITSVGFWLGFGEVMVLWFGSLVLAAAFGIVLMLIGKAGRKTALPFVPFILAAYAIYFANECVTKGVII